MVYICIKKVSIEKVSKIFLLYNYYDRVFKWFSGEFYYDVINVK